MSYRFENNPITEQPELVIDGWEKGIADSPYQGITSIRNLNIRYLPGGVYSNYKRILNSTTAGSAVFTANPSTDAISTTFSPFNVGDAFTVSNSGGALPGGLSADTIYYKANSGNRVTASFDVNTPGTLIDITDAGSGTNTLTMLTPGRATYWTQNPLSTIYYIQDINARVWQSQGALGYWTLLTGNEDHLGVGNGIVVYKGYLFNFHGTVVDYCGDGSSSGIIAANWSFDWQTGLTGSHMALWGQDDIMYFCNGNSVGSVAQVGSTTFDPGGSQGTDYNYNSSALKLPTFEQNATWLAELQVNLLVAAGKRIYPWDRTSPSFNIPVFIKETINRMINIMNVIYVLAGVKGNIYITNGYSISPFKKIPDSFFTNSSTGVTIIDPKISWGDLMGHRNKLYFGAGQSNNLTPFTGIAGVFSLAINSPTTTTSFETVGSLNFENQSSFGLNSAGRDNAGPNVLIDLDDADNDAYASAWYDGTNAGMDKNLIALYSSYECVIESDLINVADKSAPKTFSSAEFKLDEPMVAGDSIRLSARSSLNDTYTIIGTTSTGVISDFYQSFPIQNNQWLQIKVEMLSGGANRYVRLREIRIR